MIIKLWRQFGKIHIRCSLEFQQMNVYKYLLKMYTNYEEEFLSSLPSLTLIGILMCPGS